MIKIRSSKSRGYTQKGWLDSKHSFSFGNYYDPLNLGFGPIKVVNEDIIKPKRGFPTHSHQNMEIITFILEGALEHKDSMGNDSIIAPGDVQIMSAGTGVSHSEYNSLDDKETHLLQIWLEPNQLGLKPSYKQRNFTELRADNPITLLLSPDGQNKSLVINQDTYIYCLDLELGEDLEFNINLNRQIYVHIASGKVILENHMLTAGDAAEITSLQKINFYSKAPSQVLLFDLSTS